MTSTPLIRRLQSADGPCALNLYAELVTAVPVPRDEAGLTRFEDILNHPGTSIWGADVAGGIRSMATLHLIPNMTYGGRPYALVENVVTQESHREKGLGGMVMQAVISDAWARDAYKIMLLTGQTYGARGFYETLGFTAEDKFGMTMRQVPSRG